MPAFRIEPRIQALEHLAERIRAKAERSSAHQLLFGQVVRLAAGLEALGNLHSKRDPTINDAAHTKKVSTAAALLAKESTAALNRMNAAVHSGLDDIQKRIRSKVRLVPDAYAGEVRATFRGMPKTDQFKLLGTLVAEGRAAELAAIVLAPATLTGLSKDHADRFARAIVEKHAAAESAEEDELMKSYEEALMALDPVKETVAAYSSPEQMAEITRAEQAATAAAKQFKESMPS